MRSGYKVAGACPVGDPLGGMQAANKLVQKKNQTTVIR